MNEGSNSTDSEIDSHGVVSSDSGEYQDLPIVVDAQGNAKEEINGSGDNTQGSFVFSEKSSKSSKTITDMKSSYEERSLFTPDRQNNFTRSKTKVIKEKTFVRESAKAQRLRIR